MQWIESLHVVYAGCLAGLSCLPCIFVKLATVPPGWTAEPEPALAVHKPS